MSIEIGAIKTMVGKFWIHSTDGESHLAVIGEILHEGDRIIGGSDNTSNSTFSIDLVGNIDQDIALGANEILTLDRMFMVNVLGMEDTQNTQAPLLAAWDGLSDQLSSTIEENKDVLAVADTDVEEGETAAGGAASDGQITPANFEERIGAITDVRTVLLSTDVDGVATEMISPLTSSIILEEELINNAPIANIDNSTGSQNDVLTTQEDTSLTIATSTLLANDIDPDGDTLTIVSVQGAVNGTVVLNLDGTITFTPAANYNGDEASFTYTISDGNGATATALVNVGVTPVNDAPIASGTEVETTEDSFINGILPAATDVDNDTVTYALDAGNVPSNGTVLIHPDGTYTYTPDKNYSGSDSFMYTVSDGQGGSNMYEVNITVNPVSDAPRLELSLVLSDNSLPIYVDETKYNLHKNNTTTEVIELDEEATSALISLKSYKVDVDDGTIILRYEGEIVKVISIDDVFPNLHNEDKIISVNAEGVLFDSIEINSLDNSEFKVERIHAYNGNYEYTLNINDASLSDDTETLGEYVKVAGLPAGAVLINTGDETLFTSVDDNGVAFLAPAPDSSWTMTLNQVLPDDTTIIATLTSTDGDAVSAITAVGVYGDNDITGGDGNDILSGGDGNDILISDVGTIGGDSQIDGGAGMDTLILAKDGNSIDFSVLGADGVIKNIENIDLGHGGDSDNHLLTNLTLENVIQMTDENYTLTIMGDASDFVNIPEAAGNYSDPVITTEAGFDIYTYIGATDDPTVILKIETTISDTIV